MGVLGGQLYAAGGHDGPLVRKSVEVFDPQTNSWRLVCDMNMCRRNAGQTLPPTLCSYWDSMLLMGLQCARVQDLIVLFCFFLLYETF